MSDAVADDGLVELEAGQLDDDLHLRQEHREQAELGEAEAARGKSESGELHDTGHGLAARQKPGILERGAKDLPRLSL